MKRTASCSDVQQLAEQLMIREFSHQLERELGKATIPIGRAKVTVDGFHRDENRVTLVEAWAHVGKAKAAQRNKVLSDMLKLALVTSVLRTLSQLESGFLSDLRRRRGCERGEWKGLGVAWQRRNLGSRHR